MGLVFRQPQLVEMCFVIFGNNEGAIAIANNPNNASRSKRTTHVKFHFTAFRNSRVPERFRSFM